MQDQLAAKRCIYLIFKQLIINFCQGENHCHWYVFKVKKKLLNTYFNLFSSWSTSIEYAHLKCPSGHALCP